MDQRFKRRSIGPKALPAGRLSAGVGYVCIPPAEDRDTYIAQCYRTGTVAMYTEDKEFIYDVKMDKHDLMFADFPETAEDLGSGVAWVLSPLHKKPTIVALLTKSDENTDVREHQFKFRKETDSAYAEVSARGDKGLLFMSVDSDDEDGGKMNVTIGNKNNTGSLDVSIKGSARIEATDSIDLYASKNFRITVEDPLSDDKKMVLEYSKEEGLTYTDEFENTITAKEGEINFISDSLKFSDGAEPMVLGETLKTLMDDFITAVSSITTATVIGAQPIINKAQVEALNQRTQDILSKIATLS